MCSLLLETVRHLTVSFARPLIFISVGVYMSGPFLGKIVDARGPRPLLIAAFILLLSSYSGIRGIFDAGLGKGEDLSTLRLIILVLCSCFSGVGGHAGMASAMNTTAKNFPDHLVSPTTPYILPPYVSPPL
jgi:MFS family permease